MLRPCSSEIDDGLSLARQYGGRGPDGIKIWRHTSPLCENMTSSTVHNVSQRQRRQSRTEPQPQTTTCTKVGEVESSRGFRVMRVDRQTDRQTNRHTHHNTSQSRPYVRYLSIYYRLCISTSLCKLENNISKHRVTDFAARWRIVELMVGKWEKLFKSVWFTLDIRTISTRVYCNRHGPIEIIKQTFRHCMRLTSIAKLKLM